MNNTLPGWLRPRQAAQYLSIGNRTLASWMRDGVVKYSKVGNVVLIERAHLDEVMRGRQVASDVDRIVNEIRI